MSKPINIGFIGLGAMGWPMAANLVEKTSEHARLYVFDVVGSTVQKLHALDEKKVRPCQSAKEVASNSDIVFTIVPEGSHARSVYLDSASGVISGSLRSTIYVDCSTIDVETSLHVAEELRKKHPEISFYNAPVSGGVLGAEKGTLTIMLGCAQDDPNFAYPKWVDRTIYCSILRFEFVRDEIYRKPQYISDYPLFDYFSNYIRSTNPDPISLETKGVFRISGSYYLSDFQPSSPCG